MGKRHRLIRYGVQFILWLFVGYLIWLSFRDIPPQAVFATLKSVEWWQYGLLIIANGFVLLFKYLRWWVILRYQQYQLPFWQLAGIRQAAFAVSIVTPGPQFGGEPVQVLALTNRYQVPSDQAIASVLLDRAIELTVSFSYIIGGTLLLLVQHQLGFSSLTFGLVGIVVLLPLGYLLSLRFDRHPLSLLVRPFPQLFALINPSEQEMSRFLKQDNQRLGVLLLISVIGFMAQMVEYGLMLLVLDVPLQLMEFLTLFTFIRLSLFVPTPAGLGAVESGQILTFASFGFNPATAVSLTILIRIRDIVLVCLGLWFVGKISKK